MKTPVPERFWSRVTILGDDECWPWIGQKTSKGYGVFWNGKRPVRAHRYAFEFTKEPISPGLLIRHTCDNPQCCNPLHLVKGTCQDNTNDIWERGIRGSGKKPKVAKLNEEDVKRIRAEYNKGNTTTQLAQEYSVTLHNIRAIIHRKTWQHVT